MKRGGGAVKYLVKLLLVVVLLCICAPGLYAGAQAKARTLGLERDLQFPNELCVCWGWACLRSHLKREAPIQLSDIKKLKGEKLGPFMCVSKWLSY